MGEVNVDSQESLRLGKAIQLARQSAELTQQDLCHRAELSYSTLAKIERGAIKTPSVFTVYRIAEVLGISMDDIMGAVVDNTPSKKTPKQISKNGITFVYFDINGCLVRFFHGAFTRIANDTGVSSDRIESAFWHYNDAVCRGDLSYEEFNQKLAHQLGLQSINWNDYYLEAIEPIAEMHEVLAWVSKHYKLGLLSNIMSGQIDIMIKKGILPQLPYDTIIDSSEVKAIKPESEIYEIAEQRAGVPPTEILFVDDSRTNLMAAERRGWKVMWFDDFHSHDSSEKIRNALEF